VPNSLEFTKIGVVIQADADGGKGRYTKHWDQGVNGAFGACFWLKRTV